MRFRTEYNMPLWTLPPWTWSCRTLRPMPDSAHRQSRFYNTPGCIQKSNRCRHCSWHWPGIRCNRRPPTWPCHNNLHCICMWYRRRNWFRWGCKRRAQRKHSPMSTLWRMSIICIFAFYTSARINIWGNWCCLSWLDIVCCTANQM